MPGIFALVALVIGYMLSGNYHPSRTATITPTPTVMEKTHVVVTATLTPTVTDTPTPTESPTPTNTPTPSFTPTPTRKPTTTQTSTPKPAATIIYSTPTPTTAPVVQSGGGGYACDCSKTCPQMSSCAEAQYQLNVCGCTARDADHDGTACDAQCQ